MSPAVAVSPTDIPTTSPSSPPPPVAAERRWRWSTAQFRQLAETGYFGATQGVFLWDGEILESMAPGRPHVNTSVTLADLLKGLFSRHDWTVDTEAPLALKEGFEPQPDVLLLRGSRDVYLQRIPTPGDVVLLVEVSGSTYHHDSGRYLTEYARCGISLFWIVNLTARRVEVYSDPDPERGVYRSRVDYAAGAMIPVAGREIAADDLLRYLV